MKGLYQFIREVWRKPETEELKKERLVEWRKEPRFKRIEKPTRLDRARALGYKAKKGFIIVRARMRKGGRRRRLYGRGGRKPSKTGLTDFTPKKSLQTIIEERVQRKYPNLNVLNSYYVGEDGRYVWYEVILIDPSRPEIKSDQNLSWITQKKHRKRVYRGLTASGKHSRNLK